MKNESVTTRHGPIKDIGTFLILLTLFGFALSVLCVFVVVSYRMVFQ